MFKMFKECPLSAKIVVIVAFVSMAAAFIVPTAIFLVERFA